MDGSASQHTLTGLKRWSCQDPTILPDMDKIRAIHVYDFDNTLFCSPLPNKQVWASPSIGTLQALEQISTGGWWHDANILASTGKGLEEEEKTAWSGWWNENIVDLVRLSMNQKDALTVLLTGRNERGFADLVTRMFRAKKLEFDMVCLKPAVGPSGQRFSSTMLFKQDLLRDLVCTYSDAEEIRIYEDRPKHIPRLLRYLQSLLTEESTTLDPIVEVSEVQRMINTHNQAVLGGEVPGLVPLAIKRNVFYTGYLISPQDTERFAALTKNTSDRDWRTLANNILITPRPAPQSILNKVGGLGHRMTWRVTGISHFENKLWAARVEPADPRARFHSENPTPTVVISLRNNARPIDAKYVSNWQPTTPEQSFEFDTVVGEKVLLRIERETHDEYDYNASSKASNKPQYRHRDEDFPVLGSNSQAPKEHHPSQLDPTAMQFGPNVPTGPGQNRGNYTGHNSRGGGVSKPGGNNNGRGGRGGRGRGGNRFGGKGRGGRGRGGSYRSLDDRQESYGGAGMQY
ncbi:unnamed protein product [Aureobasidium mustum]|uniref:Swiss Army Knife RNA repair protein HAD domain-containing protein n=1 Tax=Aureobasidium mustum TaxID=2773714 RepID=A0A9N8P843_9PEZI|nr:unnamed protein product [Aureobasidium mustum]